MINRMNKIMKANELIKKAMQCLEEMPAGGIGSDCATQADLDEASESGHCIWDNAETHQGQQAWLYLNEALEILEKK